MKRFIFVLLFFFITAQEVLSIEVVYPKKNNVQINAKSTFFIGNAFPHEHLKINGEIVPVLQRGEFAFVVPLKYGENVFNLTTETQKIIYKITRPKPTGKITPIVLKEFPERPFVVKTEGATLRQTPFDSGINRLSQLPKETTLVINGEKGSFYRVKLSENEFAWISKNEVQISDEINYKPAKARKIHCRHDKEFEYHRFKLSKKVPFSILNQDERIILKFYNTNKPIEFVSNKHFGFDYYYDDKIFVLKIRKEIQEKPIITIDAGHGGKELGAIGCNGDREKDINLKIAKYLKQELEKDFNVVLTRETDEQISLKTRVDIAKENKSFLLVSIHANALPDGENPNWHRGTSVYYYHNQAKPLAEIILNEMTFQVGTKNDKVRQKSLALVRPTHSISVLVETAYMINPYDNIMLSNDYYQKQMAKAIADGIKKYLKSCF